MKLNLTLFLLLSSLSVYCQATNELVAYTQEYQFKEGIFPTFNSWKNNAPIEKDCIITNLDKADKSFYQKIFELKSIKYFDVAENKHKVMTTNNVFGYSRDNLVFTKEHYRINIIGAICHYSSISTIKNNRGEMEVRVLGPHHQNIKTKSIRSYIIDFEKNTKYRFDKKSLEVILKRDEELFGEYKKSKAAKRVKMFEFMFKYNEKHPIYFP